MDEFEPVWSFFSGAMGLDLGLQRAGLHSSLAIEVNKDCRATIARNTDIYLPDWPEARPGDVSAMNAVTLRRLAKDDRKVFLMAGGPPCQSFSTGGKRSALNDPRGNMIYEYLRLIDEVKPQYFVLENVANLVTAAIRHRPIKDRPGKHWSLKKYSGQQFDCRNGEKPLDDDELSGTAIKQILKDIRKLGYKISFSILNSADFGAPQKRLRFVMIGFRGEAAVSMPSPTHGDGDGLKPYVTLRDAIADIQHAPGPHSVYTDEVKSFFRLVPEGGNWRHLPEEFKRNAMGKSFESGGGKTGFYRRLAWDSVTPTITGRANRKGSAICHPEETRPLSVRECSRVQGFPDDWCFSGSMSSQYLQVGNAVPIQLGHAIGRAIMSHSEGIGANDELPWDFQLDLAIRKLRASARNKRGASPSIKQGQLF